MRESTLTPPQRCHRRRSQLDPVREHHEPEPRDALDHGEHVRVHYPLAGEVAVEQRMRLQELIARLRQTGAPAGSVDMDR